MARYTSRRRREGTRKRGIMSQSGGKAKSDRAKWKGMQGSVKDEESASNIFERASQISSNGVGIHCRVCPIRQNRFVSSEAGSTSVSSDGSTSYMS